VVSLGCASLDSGSSLALPSPADGSSFTSRGPKLYAATLVSLGCASLDSGSSLALPCCLVSLASLARLLLVAGASLVA